jgi:uncharacterized protein YndB with AHSA1/START domain
MSKTQISAPAGVPFVEISREFDAPRSLLYRAYTEPDLVKQWLGPRRLEMVIDRWEPRAGGSYRYIHRDADGNEFAFHGVFHSTDMDNLVQTFEFEGAPGHVSLDRLILEEQDGRTIVRTRSVFETVADRDAMIEHGMASGVEEGFDRLEELLERMAAPVGR